MNKMCYEQRPRDDLRKQIRFVVQALFALCLTTTPLALQAQTLPASGNILAAENNGISEISGTDFKVIQTFPWPEIGEDILDTTQFSQIAYDGKKTIYVLASDRIEGALKNPRALKLDVATGKWRGSLNWPELDQEYDRMALVADQLIVGGRRQCLQINLASGKIYRLPTGRIAGSGSEDGLDSIFLADYASDRELPLTQIDLSDGSIVGKFPGYPSGDYAFLESGKGFSIGSSDFAQFDITQKENPRTRMPKLSKRGMNKGSTKRGYRIRSDNTIQRLNNERLVFSLRSDCRLFTIKSDLDVESLEAHEFDFNTGSIVVVK